MGRKICKGCGEPFEPRSSMDTVCSSGCGASYVRQHLSRGASPIARAPMARTGQLLTRRRPMAARSSIQADPRRARAAGAGTHPGSELRRLIRCALTAFNAYIRERDAHLGCISCGTHRAMAFHAGHFLSRGAHPELRFDEANCHLQCCVCNTTKAGNVIAYRAALVRRIGLAEVERLERSHATHKWQRSELEEIARRYTAKLKALRTSRATMAAPSYFHGASP